MPPKTDAITYRPGQAAEHFCPYLPHAPAWFIDLGPGSAEEHLDARRAWPACHLLGMEPSPVGYAAALRRWPDNGRLLPAAAWDTDGELALHKANDILHGTAFANYDAILADAPGGTTGDMVRVVCRSLDSLDREYGPFADVALWMDVEGAEQRVLRGAAGLLARRAILAVNVETRPANAAEIGQVLEGAGMRRVNRYLACATYWDDVWVLDGGQEK